MAVTIGPQPQHTGGLSQAIDLWDRFAGPGSKLRAQTLTNMQQQYQINAAAEERAKALQVPTLAQANAQADIMKNTLAKSNTDEATRKGGIDALNNAPATMWKPTTSMSPDELQQWRDHATKHGITDIGTFASAWNKSVGNVTGKMAMPEGSYPTQFQNTDGSVSVGGAVVPKGIENIFGGAFGLTPPAAPGAQAPAAPAPGAQAAPAAAGGVPPLNLTPVQPPAQGSASVAAPSGTAPTVPTMQSLLPIAANPFARGVAENAIKMQNDLATNEEKRQALEKGQRDVAFGTPEERKSESEFIRNAAQLSHRLEQYRRVVGGPFVDSDGKPTKDGVGNWEWYNPTGAAMLNSLPLDISDNWTKITNPGGVLREGLVHLGKELQIPTANDHWYGALGFGPRNDTTMKGIEQTEHVLADYIRQYENMPTTKQPVTGLTPSLRQLVGQTKFGKPEDIATEQTRMPWEKSAGTDFKDISEFQAASKAGQVSVDKPVNIGGVTYVPGPNGWEPQKATNAPPTKPVPPEAMAVDAAMRQGVLPNLGPFLLPH